MFGSVKYYSDICTIKLKTINNMDLFYDVHVFVSRKNGFSVPVKIENAIEHLDDDAVILEAVNQGVLDADDAKMVDYVEEITELDYNDMKGI
jgi:uncharacterized protein YfkK (UPF0435 family)